MGRVCWKVYVYYYRVNEFELSLLKVNFRLAREVYFDV